MFSKITVNKYKYKDYISILTFFLAALLFSCNEKQAGRQIESSFYYWKSGFKLTGFEKQRLDSLNIKTIYIKFFDVDWDAATNQPSPKAVIRFTDSSYKQFNIIPTVFITNECIQKIDSSQIGATATKIITLVKQIIFNNTFKEVPEVQIDCDWTAGTKEKYFSITRQYFIFD